MWSTFAYVPCYGLCGHLRMEENKISVLVACNEFDLFSLFWRFPFAPLHHEWEVNKIYECVHLPRHLASSSKFFDGCSSGYRKGKNVVELAQDCSLHWSIVINNVDDLNEPKLFLDHRWPTPRSTNDTLLGCVMPSRVPQHKNIRSHHQNIIVCEELMPKDNLHIRLSAG